MAVKAKKKAARKAVKKTAVKKTAVKKVAVKKVATKKKAAPKKSAAKRGKKSVTSGKQVARYWWTYPGKRLKDPIIWEVGQRFKVITNVRTASVDIDMGIVGIQLEGEREEIKRAIAWVEKKGVNVEPVEIGAIAS